MVIAKVKTVNNIYRVVRYVLVDRTPDAQRVYTNIGSAFESETDTPKTIADRISDEFKATAGLKPEISRPYYHISLSPDKDDNLSLGEWRSFSRDFLDEMGLRDHQAVAYLHEDTTFPDGSCRPHLHFIINLINEYGDSASTRNDYFRTESVLRKLEHAYNLTPVTPSWETQRRRDTSYSAQATTVNSTARSQIQQAIDEALPQSSTLDEFQERLEQQGITVKHYDHEFEDRKTGWAFEKDGVHLGGYQLGRAYTKPAITRTLQQRTLTNQAQVPAASSQEDIAPSQTSQPKRSMGEILRLSQNSDQIPNQPPSEPEQPEQADQLEELHSTQSLGRSLLDFGNRTQTQTPEVDGMTVIGTAASLAGVAVTLGGAFQQALMEGRQQAQNQRLAGLIDRLQDIGDRTSTLEEHLADQQKSAAPETQPVTKTKILTDRPSEEAFQAPEADSFPDLWFDRDEDSASETAQPPESGVFAKEKQPSDPLNDSLSIANARLDRLDRLAGIDATYEGKRARFHLDRRAPLSKQLDQLEAAINTLSDRLERLEEVVLGTQQQSSDAIAPEGVAESLFNYVNSRAEIYKIPPSDPIQTQTLGTIALQEDDDSTTVSVTDETYGVKFEAVKLNSDLGEAPTWVITHNDLSPAEAARIVRQPQTPDNYEKQANARELIGYFKRTAPEQFAGQEGGIVWEEKSGEFTYSFHITKQPDGGQRITGVNADQETVFATQIHPDGTIQAQQSDIPTDLINDLLTDERAQQRSCQRERNHQRTKDRQLSL